MAGSEIKAAWPGWETVRVIGRGSFGAVYEIERELLGEREKAAMKLITIPQSSGDIDELYSEGYDEESITETFKKYLKNIVAEYSLMRKMNGSANIVNCDDVRYIQHDDGIGWDIYIKMELLTPLAKALEKTVPDEQVIRIGMDIARALVLCKKHSIIHRDIKPANIFVSDNGDYKLGDFGIAKTVEKTSGGTKIGTYEYMAPEVYHDQPYGSTADIYSLGMVLYWLLNERRTPFLALPPALPTAPEKEQARKRRFRGEPLPPPKHGSSALRSIVLKACAYRPEDRYPSAEELLRDLQALEMGYEPIPRPVSTRMSAAVDDEEATVVEPQHFDEEATVVEPQHFDEEATVVEPQRFDEEATVVEPQRFDEEATIVEAHFDDEATIVEPHFDHEATIVEPQHFDDEATIFEPHFDDEATVVESGAGAKQNAAAPLRSAVVQQGSLGAQLKWAYHEDGTLAVSGNGVMIDYARPWMPYRESIRRIVIGEGITRIGANAFQGCANLDSIVLPSSLKSVGPAAFSGCDQLKKIDCAGDERQWAALEIGKFNDAFERLTPRWKAAVPQPEAAPKEKRPIPKGGTSGNSITWSCGEDGILAVSGNGVIMDYLRPWMPYRESIRRIVIGEGITRIGANTFQGCANLDSISIPASLKSVGPAAFSGCDQLKKIDFTGDERAWTELEIGKFNEAFERLSPHGKAAPQTGAHPLPQNGSSVALQWELDDLGTLIIRGSGAIDSRDKPWLEDVDRIRRIMIGRGITRIGANLFSHCANLKSVMLPDTVRSIGFGAFSDCPSLTEIRIPASLTEIEAYAFNGCHQLNTVRFPGDEEAWRRLAIGRYNIPLANAEVRFRAK